MFSCSCPLEIRVLPYIDNKCNVGKYDVDDDDNNNNNNNNNNFNHDSRLFTRYHLICKMLQETLTLISHYSIGSNQ